MDKNMTLEKRIAAELYSYQGKMSVFVDDLHGHTVEIGADEEFETASTIKPPATSRRTTRLPPSSRHISSQPCICRPAGAKPASRKKSLTSPSTLWTVPVCSGRWAWAQV